VSAVVAFLVNLSLLRADEGFLVNVGMNFNVTIVGELESILGVMLARPPAGQI